MIGVAQNQPEQIRRLGAQRQLYATSKKVFGGQLIIGGPVAFLCAIIVLFWPDSKVWIAFWTLLVVLGDIFWLTPWQKSLRNSAARIQEEFDCDVLQLKWNDLKAGKHSDPEQIKEQYLKYEKWAHTTHPLADWYSPSVDVLPIHVGRIVCQRSNCWWNSTQRRHYGGWVLGITIVTFLIVCVIALSREASLESFLLVGVMPISPLMVIGLRQFLEQREAADRLDRLKEHCDVIWRSALEGKPIAEVTAMSRNLQDEILENRRKAPPVLDFLFNRVRNDFEVRMNHASDHYVSEAKSSLGLSGV